MRLIRTNEGARQLEELMDNDPGRFAHLRSTNQDRAEVLDVGGATTGQQSARPACPDVARRDALLVVPREMVRE